MLLNFFFENLIRNLYGGIFQDFSVSNSVLNFENLNFGTFLGAILTSYGAQRKYFAGRLCSFQNSGSAAGIEGIPATEVLGIGRFFARKS